jgi:hypothetical protein
MLLSDAIKPLRRRRGSRSDDEYRAALEKFRLLDDGVADVLSSIEDEYGAYDEDEYGQDMDSDTRGDMLKRELRWMEGQNEILGKGGNRVVVRLSPRYAAKFAFVPKGNRQNRYESETWNAIKDTALSDLFMPIHAIGENGVMTEVALPCEGERAEQCEAMIMRGQKRLKQALAQQFGALQGMSFNDADFYFNWGLYDGKTKLLDYGQ